MDDQVSDVILRVFKEKTIVNEYLSIDHRSMQCVYECEERAWFKVQSEGNSPKQKTPRIMNSDPRLVQIKAPLEGDQLDSLQLVASVFPATWLRQGEDPQRRKPLQG